MNTSAPASRRGKGQIALALHTSTAPKVHACQKQNEKENLADPSTSPAPTPSLFRQRNPEIGRCGLVRERASRRATRLRENLNENSAK